MKIKNDDSELIMVICSCIAMIVILTVLLTLSRELSENRKQAIEIHQNSLITLKHDLDGFHDNRLKAGTCLILTKNQLSQLQELHCNE